MAKWRGYRPIVVAGQRFRWACHFHYPIEMLSVSYAKRGASWAPDTLVVRPEDKPVRWLRVTWPACCGPVVKPALVRQCIDEALRLGWLSTKPTLELTSAHLASMHDAPPNHEAVEVLCDLIAGREPRHPNVRVVRLGDPPGE